MNKLKTIFTTIVLSILLCLPVFADVRPISTSDSPVYTALGKQTTDITGKYDYTYDKETMPYIGVANDIVGTLTLTYADPSWTNFVLFKATTPIWDNIEYLCTFDSNKQFKDAHKNYAMFGVQNVLDYSQDRYYVGIFRDGGNTPTSKPGLDWQFDKCDSVGTIEFVYREPEHTHNFNLIQGDSSYHWELCSCGAEQNRELHNWITISNSATCTNPGVEKIECTVCGRSETKPTPATGHTSDTWEADSLHHWKICDVCGLQFEYGTHVKDSQGNCQICGQQHTHSWSWTGDQASLIELTKYFLFKLCSL